ncbi:MAG: radical SAM protein [Actinomycetota bacterium]|nr:radical SAM protein [Actinomycetota bacterium]
MRPPRDLTLLWALRSPCDLGCDYCYFGTLEEHREAPPAQPGQLSHLSRGDLNLAGIARFLSTMNRSRVKRVFLAGGEPLIWPSIAQVIEALTGAGVEVTVCTNGILLNRPMIRQMLFDAGVNGVSVSLDSLNPDTNDAYRPARNRKDGWRTVVSGIHALVTDRGRRATPRIGMYSVITRLNVTGLPATARFAAELGLDYFVPQPISLERDHRLYDELVLREQDLPALVEALDTVYDAELGIELPAPRYPEQIASTIRHELQRVHGCFGGHQLAFIQPDGSVWDCPSRHKIAAIARAGTQRSIATHTAAELFPVRANTGGCDCPLYSGDCVNMWPLVQDFDRFLAATGDTR